MTGGTTFAYIEATRPEYVEPVKKRAAEQYYIDYIDRALINGWITSEEHADTLALKGPEDPQYSPPITFMATETSEE